MSNIVQIFKDIQYVCNYLTNIIEDRIFAGDGIDRTRFPKFGGYLITIKNDKFPEGRSVVILGDNLIYYKTLYKLIKYILIGQTK